MRGLLITIACIFFIAVLIIGTWAFKYYTAEVRGVIGAKEHIESKDHRIYSYEHFYDLYASHRAYKDQLQAQKENLELVDSEREKNRILANIAGIKSQMARVREQYNTDARKTKTKAKFLGNDLPQRL